MVDYPTCLRLLNELLDDEREWKVITNTHLKIHQVSHPLTGVSFVVPYIYTDEGKYVNMTYTTYFGREIFNPPMDQDFSSILVKVSSLIEKRYKDEPTIEEMDEVLKNFLREVRPRMYDKKEKING